jgi:hypothetical protein
MDLTDDGYVFTKRELAVLLDVTHDKKAPLDERAIRFDQRDVFVTDRRCLLVYTARVESTRVEAFAIDANELRPLLKSIKVKDTATIRSTGAHVEIEAPRGSVAIKLKRIDPEALDLTASMLRNVAKDREVATRTDRFVIASRFIHLTSSLMTALGDPECWTMATGASESCPVRVAAGHTTAPSDALLVAMPLVPNVTYAPDSLGV